jgi:hypothetical protein
VRFYFLNFLSLAEKIFHVLKEFVRRTGKVYTHVCGRLISMSWISYLINQKLRRPPNVVREKERLDSDYEEQTNISVP